MEENKMIMDDVLETKVSDEEIAKYVSNVSPQLTTQQLNKFRRTRTYIRVYDKKIGRNDLCPCGSGKKFKKCCLGNSDYNETRELSQKEMQEVKFNTKKINDFKQPLN